MYKRFNPPVMCQTTNDYLHSTSQPRMEYVESKMVRSKKISAVAAFVMVFECKECRATATIVDEIHF